MLWVLAVIQGDPAVIDFGKGAIGARVDLTVDSHDAKSNVPRYIEPRFERLK